MTDLGGEENFDDADFDRILDHMDQEGFIKFSDFFEFESKSVFSQFFKPKKQDKENRQDFANEQQGTSEATFTEGENFSFIQDYILEREVEVSRPTLGSFREASALIQCFPHLVDLGSVPASLIRTVFLYLGFSVVELKKDLYCIENPALIGVAKQTKKNSYSFFWFDGVYSTNGLPLCRRGKLSSSRTFKNGYWQCSGED